MIFKRRLCLPSDHSPQEAREKRVGLVGQDGRPGWPGVRGRWAWMSCVCVFLRKRKPGPHEWEVYSVVFTKLSILAGSMFTGKDQMFISINVRGENQ